MPRRRLAILAVALILAGCAPWRAEHALDGEGASLAAIVPAAGPAEAEAAATIEALAEEALATLADQSLGEAERAARFRALLGRALDIPLLARFTLGAHWRVATPAQRQAFLAAFTDFILASYSRQIGGVTVSGFTVVGTAQAPGDDVLVETRIDRAEGAPVAAVWRLRKRDGVFRIIDVAVEGVSLALTRRQEFAAVIRASGGDIEGLIARLRAHAA